MTEIVLMTEADVDQVHEIECASFHTPWSRESFLNDARNPAARYVLLKENGKVQAYAGVWFVLDEAHITNIAVRPEARGRGLGEQVTRALLQLCADSGMSFATLEVRRSNLAAQNLYHKVGFVDVGYRKRYYETTEDALIMVNEHLPEAHPENDPLLTVEEEEP